jgi:dUTP pyrophosphatase
MLEPLGLPGVLSAAELRALLTSDPPLAYGLADLEEQVQPHGLDVRLDLVWTPTEVGRLGRAERALPGRRELSYDDDGWVLLPPGGYIFRLAETVCLPNDVMALGFARSTLLRSGCGIFNAVWDAGYHGRSEALLMVTNPAGFQVQRGARIAQLVFIRLPAPTRAYAGAYQGEHTA